MFLRYRGSFAVKKLDEYLLHAAECREMARTASQAHRAQLENMADTWEQLAVTRRRKLAREQTDDSAEPAED
jgi:hypothetical protein